MPKKINKQPCDLELKLTVDCETYFDVKSIDNMCTRYGIFLAVIMGARGIGKTENNLGDCLEDFKFHCDEFIYLRRYKSELAGAGDLLKKWVDGYKYIGDRNGGGSYYWEGHKLGYAVPLSVHGNYKSGFDFTKVTKIIFDEAILMPSSSQRYLTNEVEQLLEFISTVARHRKNIRVYILGNNLSFFNPYVVYFNVKVFKDKYMDVNRGLFIGFFKDSPKLRAIEENTPLFKLTKGTAYHDYHYNNVALAKSVVQFTNKTVNDKIYVRLIMNNYTLNIYTRSGKMLCECVQKKFDDGLTIKMLDNGDCNWFNFDMFKQTYYKLIFYKYYNDEMLYCSQDAFSLLQELLDLF